MARGDTLEAERYTSEVVGEEFEATPYQGDDLPQSMARTMWLPVLAMGVMMVLGGLAAGAVAGLSIGDFFGGTSGADSFGRGQATAAWAVGVKFLGMAFILGGITMVLVNILRTLRDSGADVQESLGAEAVQLRKPLTGKLIAPVMMLGWMIAGLGLVFGAVQATKLGAIDPGVLAQGASAMTSADLARFGAVEAIGQFVGGIRFVGLAAVFGSIVLALVTIVRTLRFQAFRVTELVAGGAEAHAGHDLHVARRKRVTRRGAYNPVDDAPSTGSYSCACGDFAVLVREEATFPVCPEEGDDREHYYRKTRKSSKSKSA